MKEIMSWLQFGGRLNILLLGAVVLLIDPFVRYASTMVGKAVFGALIVVAAILLYRASRRAS